MIYFDNSATTSVLPAAADIAVNYMTRQFYNPAAAYSPAVAVEKDVTAARTRLASYLNAAPSELIFTSGGTESNNMAIFGTLGARKEKGRVITSAVEHPSVYEPIMSLRDKGYEVIIIGVDAAGRVRLDELSSALIPSVSFVSIMHINNETGAVNDIGAVYRLLQSHCPDAVLHVDGVQAYLKAPPVKCDMYSFSGHKIHSPKGIGGLYVRKGVRFKGGQAGGGQENGLRSGTTNVPAIMAMDRAAADYAANRAAYHDNMLKVKSRLYSNLSRIRDTRLNGPSVEDGAAHILNMSFLGVRGEVLLHSLMDKGLLVSTGSACSARHKGKNRILNAMGISSERQDGAIRFSFCPFNTVDEADTAAQLIEDSLILLRRFRRR